jgi:hypothetical protein
MLMISSENFYRLYSAADDANFWSGGEALNFLSSLLMASSLAVRGSLRVWSDFNSERLYDTVDIINQFVEVMQLYECHDRYFPI